MIRLTIRLDSYTKEIGLISNQTFYDYDDFNQIDNEKVRLLLEILKRMKLELDKKIDEIIQDALKKVKP